MSRKIKVINVVLSAPYQIGENSYTDICKTVQLAIPDDGHDWHVYGESGNEVMEQASIKIQSVRRKHGTGGQTMRLIDADKLMDSLKGNVLIDVTPELEDTIAQQPTAFDKEKVIEKIKEIMNDESIRFVDQAVNRTIEIIEIVEKGGIE